MGDVIFMDVAQKRRDETLNDLWTAYVEARDRAEKSGDIRDGIAAGKAWAAWLDKFRAVCA